jgi:hypothetical protein
MRVVPTFEINLDLPPSQRWVHILKEYSEIIPKIKKEIDIIIDSILNTPTYFLISSVISYYKNTKSMMYIDELVCISEMTGIDFEKLVIFQIYYEMNAACTSVVTKVDDQYMLYRTMDWPMEFLKSITINVNFMKNNKILYHSTTFLGYVGCFTCTIPNKCSLAINYRRTTEMNTLNTLNNVYSIMTMKWPIGYLIRDVCEKHENIDIKKTLLYSELISPCYIIMCSVLKNPIIIERNPTTHKITENEYVVQTNCDQDKQEPNILYSVERRKLVLESINSNKNKNNYKDIDDIVKQFTKFPIINDQTIYLSLCSPANGLHNSFII